MKFFCREHFTICRECRVHFEPYPDGYGEPFDLCPVHREPAMALLCRRRTVEVWAANNWEKLEPQALAEIAEMEKAQQQRQSFGATMARQAEQTRAAAGMGLASQLFGGMLG